MKQMAAALLIPALLLALTGCGAAPEPTPEIQATVQGTVVPETAVPETTVPEETQSGELTGDTFVRVLDYLPGASQFLVYGTQDNFTETVIYEFSDAYLRYGTVKKLAMAAQELEQQGYNLLIWDAFRPVSAQRTLWEVCPDPNYVSDPETGSSSHSRGNTVDLTLVDENGVPVEMPSDFDDFSDLADRDYSDCSEEAAKNAALLEEVMEKHGFTGYSREWWHFTDTEEYPVEGSFQPLAPEWYYAACEEFITLRTAPDTAAQALTTIPAGGEFQVLARMEDFFLVEYQGRQGYVLEAYTEPAKLTGAAFPEIWEANCNEFISLRTEPNAASTRLARIPDGDTFELLGWDGKFAKVRYMDQVGYVLSNYIWPQTPQWSSQILKTVPLTDTYSYERMLQDMDTMVRSYPALVEKDSIGTSELGRDIPVLRIGSPDAEYQVLLQGSIHGREHMTAWLLMAMTDYWLENGMERLTENICFHIIPMSNPDGVILSQSGQVTGEAARIYSIDMAQGYGDESEAEYAAHWKANALGVDLNRNFPAQWDGISQHRTLPSAELYKGDEPFCAAESRSLRDYTLAGDFDVTISYHASGCIIYYEFGDREPVNSESLSLGLAVEAATGYTLTDGTGITGGGYKDWAMEELGIPSLTIEIGCDAAPLDSAELYSTFSRNCGVFHAIRRWLQERQ